jgi:NACalpha-BTF3-like transcription factor
MKDLIKEDPHTEKDYVPFMVNRGLSYFGDTVMYANEMNMHASIPKKWQFEFYLTGLKKKKRFSKWAKKESTSDDLKLIMQEYNYSSKRAQEALDMLTDEQLKSIRESYKTGGK